MGKIQTYSNIEQEKAWKWWELLSATLFKYLGKRK